MARTDRGRKNDGDNEKAGQRQSLSTIKDVAVEAMKDARPREKLVVALCVFIAVICLAACPFFTGSPWMALTCILVAFLIFAFAIWVVFAWGVPPAVVAADAHGAQAAAAGRVVWSRMIPRLPISDDGVDKIRASIEAVRNEAFAHVIRKNKKVSLEDIRVNVFLPNCLSAPGSEICVLSIHKDLQVGMDGHDDLNIQFRPGQGLTGQVFASGGKPRIAMTLKDEDGASAFDETHQLTARQKAIAHPELRWIVSFPLAVPMEGGVRRSVCAVLNVDGLRHEVKKEHLLQLCATLSPQAMLLSDTFEHLPKLLVSVVHQEI
jgi:hypothetical protein